MAEELCTKCKIRPPAGKDKNLCWICRDALERENATKYGLTMAEIQNPFDE